MCMIVCLRVRDIVSRSVFVSLSSCVCVSL